jgi:hypothetical protein
MCVCVYVCVCLYEKGEGTYLPLHCVDNPEIVECL